MASGFQRAGNMEMDPKTRAVIKSLKTLYNEKIRPLEEKFLYHQFYSPCLTDSIFDAKPQVLLLGQYSTGKTTFIRYLLGQDFQGARIGPEPTTDGFLAVLDGEEDRVIPGNSLAISANMPFNGLDRFGVSFLSKFQGSISNAPLLKQLTLIDTPGVLSGSKQTLQRGYDYIQVIKWFAERADLILLLFDAHKLDISDEFKSCIEVLKGEDDKVRCVLNKADQVDRQRLMRVYGALMWSLGKVIKTPEVLRVYVGSFWEQPLLFDDNKELFNLEHQDLMKDLADLPRNSALRKINELVKRTRLLRVHVCLLGYLRSQMPMLWKEKKQEELLNDLPNVFRTVMNMHNLPPGDFPDIEAFRIKLSTMNFSKFSRALPERLEILNTVLKYSIPKLMDLLPKKSDLIEQEEYMNSQMPSSNSSSTSSAPILGLHSASSVPVPPPRTIPVAELYDGDSSNTGTGGSSSTVNSTPQTSKSNFIPPSTSPIDETDDNSEGGNPFDDDDDEQEKNDINKDWVLYEKQQQVRCQFDSASPQLIRSKMVLKGKDVRSILMDTGVPKSQLKTIWALSDLDKDGNLDLEEFTIAMHLVEEFLSKQEVPATLPPDFIPPSKKNL